jgi:DNA-binding MarR family transcriptional regulator
VQMDKLYMPNDVKELIESMINLRISMKQFIHRRVKEENIDLTYEMLQVLTVLWRSGDLNQQDIANSIQKNKASLTSLLDNLAKRKLVIRNEDPSDRRNKIVSLTKLGRDYKEQFVPIFKEFYTHLQRDLSLEELKKVTSVLNSMNNNLM